MSIFDNSEHENALKRLQTLLITFCGKVEALGHAPTAENYAKACFAAVKTAAAEAGMNPDIECKLVAPNEQAYDGSGNRWMVMWESGPYQWAIGMSMLISHQHGLCEPYHSFDLCFYPNEEYQH